MSTARSRTRPAWQGLALLAAFVAVPVLLAILLIVLLMDPLIVLPPPAAAADPAHPAAQSDPALSPADPPAGLDAPPAIPDFGARRPGAALLYFFSPDWRPPDLGRLTIAVEDALSGEGVPVSFQAFTRYEDFARQANEKPPDFAIAPGWLAAAQQLAPGLCQTVLAHPIRRGKTTYRKALMARPGIDSIDDLARGSIAATLHSMSGGEASAVLGAFHLGGDSAKVVAVPKDVDALLALSFGQVDAALVTSEQYDDLESTRPAEAERLRVLAFSPEIRLPQVFACGSSDPALRQKLRDALVALVETPGGASLLALLGFDRFVAGAPPVAPPAPIAADSAKADGSTVAKPADAAAAKAADAAATKAAAKPKAKATAPPAPKKAATRPPSRSKSSSSKPVARSATKRRN